VLELRNFTMARVGLGRAGNSVSTRDLLAFQLDHARARDAVHGVFDPVALATEIGPNAVIVESAARDRQEYLRRPDLGRCLSESSRRVLERMPGSGDVVFVVGDGLSPMAVQSQAVRLLRLLGASGPVVVASQARVALSDEIGFVLQAFLAVMLIGERPGLSSFDSMGAYLTWSPRPGRTDAERNCISNIRPDGLSIGAAAELLLVLMREARARRLSGVALKAESTLRLA
jgi:ethanolamine ammonia-lyase small subunit